MDSDIDRKAMIKVAKRKAEELYDIIPDGPLKWIVGDLIELNIVKWIETQFYDDTIGQGEILQFGFTRNQLKWINELICTKKER